MNHTYANEPVLHTTPQCTRVIEIDPHTDARWESFATMHGDALIYHHPLWARVLELAYGFKLVGLACEDDKGALHGILPLCYTRGILAGRILSSLPRTPLAGPLSLDDQTTSMLVCNAISRLHSVPGTRLELKVPHDHLDTFVPGLVRVPWEATYIRALPKHPAELRFGDSRNHAQIKRAISKASRLGVEVREAETESELRQWYNMYLDTVRQHSVPPRPYRFFRIIWELLRPRGMMRLLVAEQMQAGRRRLLAGSIFFMFGQTVSYAFNGSRREDLALRPNDAIHWQAIHDAYNDGYSCYDLGEVADDNDGLGRYKRKWGAEPRRLHRYYYSLLDRPGSSSVAFAAFQHKLVSAAWRHLPLKTTALLGEWFYRYL